jgi:hypothetical protein
MTRTLWLLFTGVLVAVAGTQHANSQASTPAWDYKIFPGSFCQAQLPGDAASFQRAGGFIFNMSNPNLPTVTCPIVRDRVPHAGKTNELTKIDGGIHFNITSLGVAGLACKWISQDESGATIATLGPTTISQNGSQISMFWEIQPLNTSGNLQMALDGTYSITCAMPPLVFLLRYVVGEWDTTDQGF